jgi:hypothetical protein
MEYNHLGDVNMDIFFQDPSETPLPPEEVRIKELRAEPWPDGQRVMIYLEVDPFQKRPNADFTIFDQEGQEVAQASIIQSISRKMEFTMHLRGKPEGEFLLRSVLFYTSTLPEVKPDEQVPMEMPEVTEVDRAEIRFRIGN